MKPPRNSQFGEARAYGNIPILYFRLCVCCVVSLTFLCWNSIYNKNNASYRRRNIEMSLYGLFFLSKLEKKQRQIDSLVTRSARTPEYAVEVRKKERRSGKAAYVAFHLTLRDFLRMQTHGLSVCVICWIELTGFIVFSV